MQLPSLVIVSVYTVDIDAVVAAADSDAGADVALAVVHSTDDAGIGIVVTGTRHRTSGCTCG